MENLLPAVADLVGEVQVEGAFPDRTKLVTARHPICREHRAPALALYSSGLTRTPRAGPPIRSSTPSPANTCWPTATLC